MSTGDNSNGANASGTSSSASIVSAVALHLPPFWDRNPSIWFLQADPQFHLPGITSQATKYHYIITALSNWAAEEVSDIIAIPPAINLYDVLKATLLRRTAASERSRFHQLLSAEKLGDRRPTQLLRRMTQLLGERAHAVDDVLLRELFLQRLPANVHMVLAAAGIIDLSALAALSDAVMEVTVSSISAVANLTATGILAATPASAPSETQPPAD